MRLGRSAVTRWSASPQGLHSQGSKLEALGWAQTGCSLKQVVLGCQVSGPPQSAQRSVGVFASMWASAVLAEGAELRCWVLTRQCWIPSVKPPAKAKGAAISTFTSPLELSRIESKVRFVTPSFVAGPQNCDGFRIDGRIVTSRHRLFRGPTDRDAFGTEGFKRDRAWAPV